MPESWKQGIAKFAPVLVLVACITGVHAPALVGLPQSAARGAHLTAHHDNLDGAAPLRLEAARQWKSGQLPLWNPWKRAGMPLLADTTAGAIYPLNFPFLFVEAPDAGATGESVDSPIFRAMDQVAALHAVLAGVFMFVFLRVLGLGAAAGVLGALVYACSGTMGWFAAWYIQIQNSVVWLPLILAAVHRVGSGCTYPWAWVTIGGFAVALQFFAGFPETSFYSGLLAIGYALALVRRSRWWQPPAAVMAIYVVGLMLAAVQLFPSLELQALSRRPGSLSLEVFQSLPASASMVWSWLVPSPPPGLEFPPLAAYHFGAVAVLAAAIGVAALSRQTVFFVVVLAIGFLLSIGAQTPVSEWAHALPGFGAFRHPFKHLFEVSFAIAALAALGADRLMRWRSTSRWPLAVVAVLVAMTCGSLRANQHALVAANPAGVDTSGRRPDVLSHLEPGWRVLTQRHVFEKRDPAFLLGDFPSQFAVPAVHGAGPFLWVPLAEATGMVEEEITLRRGLFDARDRTLALLSGRYVLQTKQGNKFTPAVDASVWSLVSELGDTRLVERRDALPRFRFVAAVRCSDAATVAMTLREGAADPAEVALVDCAQQPHSPVALTPPHLLSIRVVDERSDFIQLATDVPDSGYGFFVTSQADYPGWRAYVDGNPTPIHRVHGVVQGVDLPGGTRRLELSYESPVLRLGAATSAAALLLLIGANILALRRKPEMTRAVH